MVGGSSDRNVYLVSAQAGIIHVFTGIFPVDRICSCRSEAFFLQADGRPRKSGGQGY